MSSRRPIIRRIEGDRRSSRSSSDSKITAEQTAPVKDRSDHPADDLVDLPLGHAAAPMPHADPLPPFAAASVRRSGRPWVVAALFVAVVPLGLAVGYSMQPKPSIPTLSTDLIAFGDRPVGASEERVIRLIATGEGSLEVRRWSVVDDPSGSFEWVAPPPCVGIALRPDTICDARIRFKPQQDGALQARLKLITGPSDDLTVTGVPLLGRGTVPRLEVRPANLQFSPTTVGYRGEPMSLSVANVGGAPFHIDGVDMGGLAAADFVQETAACVGRDLEPGKACSLSFRFVPTTAGERGAFLRLRTSPNLSTPKVEMRGLAEAQRPRLEISDHQLAFSDVRLGRASEPRVIHLRNGGDGPLEILGISVRNAVARQGDSGATIPTVDPFRVEGDECRATTLQPGGSCSLAIGFAPTGEIGRAASLSFTAVLLIEHNAAAAAKRVPMAGRGTTPRLKVGPETLPFGTVPVGRPSGWAELRLANDGSAPLSLHQVALHGTDAAQFETSAEGCIRASIPPGRSCSLQVRFTPRRPGPHRARLNLRHDGGEPVLVPVNGFGGR